MVTNVRTARRITVFDAPLGATEAITRANTRFSVPPHPHTANAPEGSVDLAPYSRIRGWLDRVEALPGFIPMVRTAVGLVG